MFATFIALEMWATSLGIALSAAASSAVHYSWSLDIMACAGSLTLFWSHLLKPRRVTAHCEALEHAQPARGGSR